ncbi:MAG: alpha/beta hydrolase family protein [Candidatus Levyibacteriota bacterium]
MGKDIFIRILVALTFFSIFAVGLLIIRKGSDPATFSEVKTYAPTPTPKSTFPLSIDYERSLSYPGSDIVIGEKLEGGSNYKKYIASYTSDGLKIYGLLTVPDGQIPPGGFPTIIFNHGYIPPKQYSTTASYASYVDVFSRSGFVVFKPDYRGNGESEGNPEGAYISPDYTNDVLNALASVRKLPYVNKNKIGMWGHSMGGNISLRSMVITKDLKAVVIWSGVVGSYEDLFYRWNPAVHTSAADQDIATHLSDIKQILVSLYGEPTASSDFWRGIDPYNYLSNVTAKVQLHQGLADDTVPPLFSEHLKSALEQDGKTTEYFTYEGADHNISQGFNQAMERSVEFFKKNLK